MSPELDEERVPCQDVVSVGSGVSDCTSDDPGGGHGPSSLNEDDKGVDGVQQEQDEEGDDLEGGGIEAVLGGDNHDKDGAGGQGELGEVDKGDDGLQQDQGVEDNALGGGWFRCIQCGWKHIRLPGAVVVAAKCKQCGGDDCCVGFVCDRCETDYQCGGCRRCSEHRT